jgi:hypothetical protein
VAATSGITIRPGDFKPAFNYIGRSQFASDPMFSGYVDDFRIYNYALSGQEIKSLYNIVSEVRPLERQQVKVYPNPATGYVMVDFQGKEVSDVQLVDMNGRILRVTDTKSASELRMDVGGVSPGVYLLKLNSGSHTEYVKLVIGDLR